jgi:hypothetical protein
MIMLSRNRIQCEYVRKRLFAFNASFCCWNLLYTHVICCSKWANNFFFSSKYEVNIFKFNVVFVDIIYACKIDETTMLWKQKPCAFNKAFFDIFRMDDCDNNLDKTMKNLVLTLITISLKSWIKFPACKIAVDIFLNCFYITFNFIKIIIN